ncbi:hypothetical protein LTR70_006135 [Exophiala xenobiotica]|uniref:MARVEL domain-containing protein n=1 Tax=Lithohypha guttulata TaxID=1690604 RepID=A0ABR0K899_9EURO|nr:hypothetical protein LTR24_005628 [Lithohypha guttulata]KAK5316888.1 hypothetical protein LTR70_006135 [Exophiala xenobiotica]
MQWKSKMKSSHTRGGFQWTNIFHMVYRFLQIIMACVVIGYYASDLNAARKVHKYADSKWVFAVVVGCMAAVTALIFAVISIFSQYRTIAMLFAWEWILVILWAAMTGLFESMYDKEKVEMQPGVRAMKTAAHFNA